VVAQLNEYTASYPDLVEINVIAATMNIALELLRGLHDGDPVLLQRIRENIYTDNTPPPDPGPEPPGWEPADVE
jgi:hypothetical protein